MPVGRSLHIGINRYSSAFPNAPVLTGPENSARAMRELAHGRGYLTELILGSDVTYARATAALLAAADVSQPGDIFLFTFSGHGAGEFDSDSDEPDIQDEALLLFDALLLDDDLRLSIWPKFRRGVRVLIIADSCHSGTVATVPNSPAPEAERAQVMEIPIETRQQHFRQYGRFYRKLAVPLLASIEASVLLLAACGDFETTLDGNPLTMFTAAMLRVVNEQSPTDYRDLIAKIDALVGPQTPVLTPVPPPDQAFIAQRPFTI